MATKTKRKLTPREDCLIVVSLTIEDCLMRLNTMANADLTVTVKHHSAYYAEVKFTDRHKDDLPFTMTSRLIAKGQHRTCVTFETPHQAQKNLKSKDEIPSLWTWIIMGVYGLMGLYVLFLLVLLSQMVIVRPETLLVFIVIGGIQYVAHSLANGSLMTQNLIRER